MRANSFSTEGRLVPQDYLAWSNTQARSLRQAPRRTYAKLLQVTGRLFCATATTDTLTCNYIKLSPWMGKWSYSSLGESPRA